MAINPVGGNNENFYGTKLNKVQPKEVEQRLLDGNESDSVELSATPKEKEEEPASYGFWGALIRLGLRINDYAGGSFWIDGHIVDRQGNDWTTGRFNPS